VKVKIETKQVIGYNDLAKVMGVDSGDLLAWMEASNDSYKQFWVDFVEDRFGSEAYDKLTKFMKENDLKDDFLVEICW
jgi:hypothetical protein